LSGTTAGGFPDDVLRRLLQHLVRHAGMLEPAQARHDHGGFDLSASDVFALAALSEDGPLSQQDLAAHLGLEKSTVSRLAAGLVERGWVIRERDPADRRFYRLTLTPAGRRTASRVGAHLRDHHTALLGRLTSQERDALGVGLSALVRAMESYADEHPHL
jgi:DNA-binding MarR family transcriptional regulator